MLNLFNTKKKSSSFLGIDLGTRGVKMVQLGFEERVAKLENYVIVEKLDCLNLEDQNKIKHISEVEIDKIANNLAEIIETTGITAKRVAMSIPVSSAFLSIMHLPHMNEDEIARAVDFEARQHIPLPLNEVVFGWNIVSKREEKENNKENNKEKDENSKASKKIEVLLVAIPKDVTDKYSNIAKQLDLELVALETESFSLARSLVGKNKGNITIVDIGDRSADITVVRDGNVLLSHSVSGMGGSEITRAISRSLNVDFYRAEALKKDIGSKMKNSEKNISEIILPVTSIITSEIRKINSAYYRSSGSEIQKIILTGGSSNVPEFINSFYDGLKIKVEMGNPWENIVYNKILSEKLEQLSPCLAVGVGLALRGAEN